MPSPTTIHADSRADVAMISDKIVRSAAHRIFLVVDNDARVALHVFNFQLLSREAEAAGKELIIVSSSIRVQALATKAGLRVQESRDGNIAPVYASGGMQNGERNSSVVRLGTRRVSDIVPRRTQDLTPVQEPPATPLSERQEDSKEKEKAPRRRDNRANESLDSARQAPRGEVSRIGETIAGGGVQDMRDILRKETQVQDSAWRTFLRSRKKSETHEKEILSGADGEASERIDERHRVRHGSLRLGSPFSSLGLTHRRSVHFPFVWGSFIVAVLLIGIFVASTILPTVTIAITPHTQKVALQIPVHTDTTVSQVDAPHHVIPGQVIQDAVENTQTFPATSTQNVQVFATGQIRVFNQYSSAPQTLVQNTRFVSKDGLLFHATQTVVIPGAQIQNGQILPSSALVSVTAAAAGDTYNINSSTFSIPGFQGTPKFTAFYGKSESAMTGGFSGTSTVVSDSDIAQAKDTLNKLASNQVRDKLTSHVPSGFVLTDDAVEQEAPSITISAKSGDRANSFTGTIQHSVRAVIFRQDDIRAIIDSYLKNEYKGDSSMDALPQAAIHYSVQTKDFTKGKFDISVQVDQIFAARVDTSTIVTMVRGMNEANLRSYLSSYPGIDQANIIFWPFWVHSVPDNSERISLKIIYAS